MFGGKYILLCTFVVIKINVKGTLWIKMGKINKHEGNKERGDSQPYEFTQTNLNMISILSFYFWFDILKLCYTIHNLVTHIFVFIFGIKCITIFEIK